MTNKPMLSVELLPCPFCGSAASLEDHRLVWCVRCTKCSACVLGDRAPEPHGDGVSSDEVQDAQAAAMSESNDWGAYQKSAVDAWNARAEKASKSQVVPDGATHFEKSDKCPSTGNIQYYRHDGCCRWSYWPEGLNYWSPLACKPTGDIQEIIDKQPAPVAVVMPERETYTKYLVGVIPHNANEVNAYKDGWNTCLEEVARLNGVKP